ncbi:MAG: ABC transporter ATP-binding protein [Alphaproteobacteria bacterium]|nr:ABC transporter ATP-binding protein [Alphaproteobacteria bacterium]
MIELNDIHLTLKSTAGPVNILRGISLNVADGEAVGLTGPSGSGKSTLMSVIAGLEQPTSGTVRIAGENIGKMNEDELALFRRGRVGIVFQSVHLIPTMTAQENVAIPLELLGEKDPFSRAAEELGIVGLKDRLHHYPSQLSGGEQQRVALARAMVANPSVLLADEPTGNLDAATGGSIIELMFELHDTRDTTLVLITHDPALAERCDRVIRLSDGQIESETQASGPVEQAGEQLGEHAG